MVGLIFLRLCCVVYFFRHDDEAPVLDVVCAGRESEQLITRLDFGIGVIELVFLNEFNVLVKLPVVVTVYS